MIKRNGNRGTGAPPAPVKTIKRQAMPQHFLGRNGGNKQRVEKIKMLLAEKGVKALKGKERRSYEAELQRLLRFVA